MAEHDSEFVIEKGIPVSPSRRGTRWNGRGMRYPFDRMVIGDSFFVPKAKDVKMQVLQAKLSGAIAYYKRAYRCPRKVFVTRALPEQGGVRVWRER